MGDGPVDCWAQSSVLLCLMAEGNEYYAIGTVSVEDFEFKARSAGAGTKSRDLYCTGDPRTYPIHTTPIPRRCVVQGMGYHEARSIEPLL